MPVQQDHVLKREGISTPQVESQEEIKHDDPHLLSENVVKRPHSDDLINNKLRKPKLVTNLFNKKL